MRAAFLFTIAAVFVSIMLVSAALQWARREPGRKYPDGVPVWYGERMRMIHRAYYHRGRWWYMLEGMEKPIRQEDLT